MWAHLGARTLEYAISASVNVFGCRQYFRGPVTLHEIGPIVAARVAFPADQITVMTSNGIVLRTQVRGISQYSRMTRGVRVVNLQDGDTVAAVAVISDADLNRGIDGLEESHAADNGVAHDATLVAADDEDLILAEPTDAEAES